ncbi:MAG TPA: hypothetical protein VH814_25695 [Steroidobacteraceae bacterium]
MTTKKSAARTPERNRFRREFDPRNLTLADLLEARDAYHTHLANLPHVVGTALGLYRIRVRDPDYARNYKHGYKDWKRFSAARARTLANSAVKDWSWPSVLVFVDEWATRKQQRKKTDEMVPPWLHLPDGRKIPTCVVYAPRQLHPEFSATQLAFPSGLYGGGYPILTAEQGTQRIGTLACLVTDGHDVYGLTNRHVVGPAGTAIYTIERGELRRLGVSVETAARKVPLATLYPGWGGQRTSVNVDAGLFRIDDLSLWTSQIYGIGRLGEPIDLNIDTLGLDVIGCPVKAYGAISGALRGSIEALFYRYSSIGGHDCVADLMIGPRPGEALVDTHPGDSGTTWVYDQPQETPGRRAPECQPIAVQWGGQSFTAPDGGPDSRFVLATMLSNVCRLLDVDVVRDWSSEQSQYWGKVGHYKIAYSACFLVSSTYPKLRALLKANALNIAVSDEDIEQGTLPKASQSKFVALADVPDLVWRSSRGRDKANHFADMDEEAQSGEFAGETLLSLWTKQPETRTPAKWNEFYESFEPKRPLQHRGALPFRVAEMFDEMVEHLRAQELDKFVCVAGTMAHYVGDACQPLHVSKLHHGADESESSVHEVYETRMLDRFAAEFVDRLNSELGSTKAKGKVTSGAQAADLTVQLMRKTMTKLPPDRVLQVFRQSSGQSQTAAMWTELGADTVAVTAQGALTLAKLWQSAWAVAKGESSFSKTECQKAIDKNRLRALYKTKSIAESNWLKDM